MSTEHVTGSFLSRRGFDDRAFDTMGCHAVTKINAEGQPQAFLQFRVWAPRATAVFLCGDFNGWSYSAPMRRENERGVWVTEIEAQRFDGECLYKYRIVSPRGEFWRADPYGVSFEMPPATASCAKPLVAYAWRDGGWLAYRAKTLKRGNLFPLNIYETHLGNWARRQDGSHLSYGELATEMACYVKQMGYTHVKLLPITEHMAYESLGFGISGYFAPTARDGEPRDFMSFVDTMHEAGIGVILDWVPTRFSKHSQALVAFDGESLFEASICGETCRFDFSRREVLDFLLSGITFWAEKYHVDGFCFCDMDGQDDEAAELIRALVEEKHPDLLLLSDRPRDGYLFINGAKAETIEAEDGEWQRLASVRAAYGYRLIDGMHLHTMGNELGQTDGVLRASLDWRCAEGEATARLQLFFAEANHFYLTHSALWKTGNPWHAAEKNVLVGYRKAAGESPLVIVVNLTPNIYYGYSLIVPEEGEYREVFNSDLAVFGGGGVENRGLLSTENRDELKITIPPFAFCVFQKQAR